MNELSQSSKKLYLFHLKPLGVLMFRKPRPFTAGTSVFAISYPFPPPNTISGAMAFLCSRVLGEDPFGKDPESVLNEKIRVLCYGWEKKQEGKWEKLFKVPEDFAFCVSKDPIIGCHYDAYPNSMINVEMPKDRKIEEKKDVISKIRRNYISEETMEKYLEGNDQELKKALLEGTGLVREEEIFKFEERPGIALDHAKIVKEGKLYFARYLRPEENTYIWVLIFPESGEDFTSLKGEIVSLGGKGGMVRVEAVEKIDDEKGDLEGDFLYQVSYGLYQRGGNIVSSIPDWADPLRSYPSPLQYFGRVSRSKSISRSESITEDRSDGKPFMSGEVLSSPGAVFKVKKRDDLANTFGFISLKGFLNSSNVVLVYDKGHWRPINVYFVKKGVRKGE